MHSTALDTDRWDCEIENQALCTQVEVLKAHLQTAEQHIACQEEKVTELSARLEAEMKNNMSLSKQMEDLINELQRERAERLELDDQLQEERASYQAERGLKTRLEQQTSSNVEIATQLEADKEMSQALQAETAKLKEELKTQEEKTLVALMAVELLVEEEISVDKAPEIKKKSSLWKRICHFFGLRSRNNRSWEEVSTSN